MLVAYRVATPAASTVSLQGMKNAAFEQSWSVMVKMVSCPSDTGSLTMKSRLIVWKGSAFASLVMGNKGGLVGFVLTFVIWQVAQPLMYSVTWPFMPGHQ